MKSTNQEKKTDLRALGFTEITNLIVIKGGADEPGTGNTEVEERRGGEEEEK